SGPAVVLQPASAQIIAVVLHELVTNAAKYGALSLPAGRLRVSWKLCDGILMLVWEEMEGPSIQAPTSRGYGTKVINASVTQQLGGTADFDWRPTGLRFVMSVPIGAVERQSNGVRKRVRARDHVASGTVSGGRLLLVEDEAL